MSKPASLRLPLRRKLFGWISFAVAIITCVLGVVQYFTLRWTLSQADDVVVQVQLWNVAQEYVNAIERGGEGSRNLPEIQNALYQFSKLNPMLDAYLVSESGEVVYSFSTLEYSPRRKKIAIEPLLQFLASGSSQQVPIYGDDPEDLKGRAVFVAAPLQLDGANYYLYGVISGRKRQRTYQLYSENYLARYFSITTLVALVVILVSATLLFYLLSRRVSRTVQTMRAFKDGDFSSRIHSTAKDELGELARTFDEMADKIVNSVHELEQRDSLRRELIAAVSHDLRGPLANIKAHLDRLQRARNAEQREGTVDTETIETVRRNADQLAELLSQLFELAKLEAREIAPQLEEHLLNPLFDDLLISYRPKAQELGLKLEYSLRDPGLTVRADLTMLGRVLSNLIENALKFTQPQGCITIEGRLVDGAVRISVRDTGSGISESELPKIFERFYQSEGASIRNLSSCGLGLAIVRRLVELQGAEIQVASKVDVGTEFYFSLPRA